MWGARSSNRRPGRALPRSSRKLRCPSPRLSQEAESVGQPGTLSPSPGDPCGPLQELFLVLAIDSVSSTQNFPVALLW